MYKINDSSIVQVHDIFDPLPDFMLTADCLFVDIPYNQSLLTNFSLREGIELSPNNTINFADFLDRLMVCISEISPKHCFVETGKESLSDAIVGLRELYKYVTFYNSTYYHKLENKSYIVHATSDYRSRRYAELEDLDESDVIKWIASNHDSRVMGDLCMGQGLVGLAAYEAGKPFVGTELNERRLAVLLQKLSKKGAKIERLTM